MSDAPPPVGAADKGAAAFGYRDVAAADKPSLVRGVFDSVADRYDLMNDLMSGGIHRLWKAAMVERLRPRPGQHFLDVAGGTGDIAGRILERLEASGGSGSRIVVCDLTARMLEVGRARAIDRGIIAGLEWVCGSAEALPFPDRTFDAYTVAFGLRNVTNIGRALIEARRVLKPGGRFLCLEFSHVALAPLARLYDLYSFRVLPTLGQIVTRDREAYQYLVESIRRFPAQEELARIIAQHGLEQVTFRNLTGGVAALHSAWRI
jgi:demethylmenaquinone methyltransferase / 2-methoxy-6-polyprenyl-1,4-benzoquinol methylase